MDVKASVWYVRKDGSNDTNCTGLTNAAYPGSGTGQACAFSHNFYATGWYYNGTSSTHGTMHMVGGDTILFRAGDDFKQGYDAAWTGCTTGAPYNCYAVPYPNGTIGNETKVYGSTYNSGCTNAPQLWGTRHAYQDLNLSNTSYIKVACLELTDHSGCMGNYGNPPITCVDTDDWARDAIGAKQASHIDFTDINAHGVGRFALQAPGASYFTFTRINFHDNAYGGMSFDLSGDTGANQVTGTMIMANSHVDYNGCGETYPGLVRNNCWGKDQSGGLNTIGYGDGIGFGNGTIGQWTITDSSVSHNTQDGFDGLHGVIGTDYLHSARNKYEGNDGQQMKVQASMTSENDFFIGDCNYFVGQSFVNTGWRSPLSTQYSSMCRAVGTTMLLGMQAGQVHKIYGATIYGIGDTVMIGSYNAAANNCNSSTKIYIRNSTIRAGREWDDDSSVHASGGNDTTGLFTPADVNGNCTGACCSNSFVDEDYNQIFGTKSGSVDVSGNGFVHGGHSRYGNQLFSGTINSGPTTYSNPDDFASQFYLGATSPARFSVTGANSADETLTFLTNGAIDYNSFSRGTNWDGGAVQFGSTLTTGCGNNVIDGTDVCDGTALTPYSSDCSTYPGFTSGTLSCKPDCSGYNTIACVAATCGDSIIQSPEQCDTANVGTNTCATLGYSAAGGTPGCSSCVLTQGTCSNIVCGNGVIDAGEQCDDGNTTNGDGCSSICETEVPGLENFLTYTYSDGTGVISLRTYKSTMLNMTHGASSNIHYDFGASHFGDFHHQFKVTISSCSDNGHGEDGGAGVWAMSSTLRADTAAQETASDGPAFTLGCLSSAARYTWKMVDGSTLKDSYDDTAPTLIRYMDVQRTGSTLTYKIYTDAAYTNLLHTLTGTVASTAYRYLYTTSSYNDGVAGTAFSGAVENMNLSAGQAAPAGTYSTRSVGCSIKGANNK